MKKMVLLVLTVIFLFGLAACDPDEPDTRKTEVSYINPDLV